MYVLLYWVGETTFSVFHASCIISPRKPFQHYIRGETVEAKWGGQIYHAVIGDISGKQK